MPVFKSLLFIKMNVMAIISTLKTPLEGLLLTQIPAQNSDTHSPASLSIWQSQQEMLSSQDKTWCNASNQFRAKISMFKSWQTPTLHPCSSESIALLWPKSTGDGLSWPEHGANNTVTHEVVGSIPVWFMYLGVGLCDPWVPLPTQNIPWFCEFV